MLPQLHSIERSCTRVQGAIHEIILIDPDDLEELPDYYLIPSVAELNFKPGKAAWVFQHDRLRGRLEDNTNTDNDNGDYFEYILTCTVRNIRLDVEYLRRKLINRRIHVVAKYGDGLQRFLPYMRLAAAGDSGERPATRNQYTFRGITRTDKPAPLIDTELSGSIGGTPAPGDPESTVTPVVITTSDPTYIYELPEGKLLTAIWIRSDDAQTVLVGTSAGGDHLGGPATLTANEPALFGSNMLRPTTATNIYFSGLAGNNTIEIWLLG